MFHYSFPPHQTALARGLLGLLLLTALSCLIGAPAYATNQVPTRTITGPDTLLANPYGLTQLANGSLAVVNRTGHSVTVYAAGADGNAAPLRRISGGNTGLNSPSAVAELADGSLAVSNFGNHSVTVYAADADGNAVPQRTIKGPNTLLWSCVGLAVLTGDALAVVNYLHGSGRVTVYAAGADGDAAPLRRIEGASTGLNTSIGLAVLTDGKLAVVNNSSSSAKSVTVYAADANGDAAPLRTISGASTGLSNSHWVAELADGTLAVTNASFPNSVTVYAADANGDAAPLRTISGASTGLSTPVGLAVLSDGALAVANYANSVRVYQSLPGAPTGLTATPGDGQATIAFTAPANTGGGISNYEYSTDDGGNWTPRDPAATNSPVTITGLVNGTTYQIKLRAVNSAGAGTASSAVSVTPMNPCGPGLALTTGAGALWQMLALPCAPSASPADVKGVFGTGSLSNLTTAAYGIPGTGWVIDRREVSTTPSSYVRLTKDDSLAVGTGYWIKSYQAPSNGMLSVAGTATATDVNQAEGCTSANGCKAVTITTVSGDNRYNLVGNPFPYAIDWSQVRVRVRVNGSTLYTPQQAAGSSGTVYTPCQAARVAEPACTGAKPAAAVISNTVNIWNGTTYVAFTDVVPNQGNLQYFKSFWVNVLPGAAGQTVELLIPAEQTTLPLSQAAPAVAQAKAAASDWRVRLKLDNHVTGWRDHGNQLGQWRAAKSGADALDVLELAPFAKPYLTLVFPHPEWGAQAGDYTADFRPHGARATDWAFEVRADPAGAVAFLSWDGDPAILRRSRLIDRQTGQTIQPAAARWAKKGYPITLKNPVQRYIWRYLGP